MVLAVALTTAVLVLLLSPTVVVTVVAFRTATRRTGTGRMVQQYQYRYRDDDNDSDDDWKHSHYVTPSDLLEHRCYYQPCLQQSQQEAAARQPLLVMCMGMAQTMLQYQAHVKYLAQHRNVLLYQPQGLGLHYCNTTTTDNDKKSNINSNNNAATFNTEMNRTNIHPPNVSLPFQVRQLREAIQHFYYYSHSSNGHGTDPTTNNSNSNMPQTETIDVDLVGFSLGGRIALAMVVDSIVAGDDQLSQRHDNVASAITIHHVHLTGVSHSRSPFGIVQGMIWNDLLAMHQPQQQGNNHHSSSLRPFGWSILSAAYSPRYLHQNRPHLHQWIESLCQSHTTHGLLQIIEQAYEHENDTAHPWSVAHMVQQIAASSSMHHHHTGRIQFQCMVGELDVLSLPPNVHELAAALRRKPDATTTTNTTIHNDDHHIDTPIVVVVVPQVGHAVPMEAPRKWRDDVQAFLSLSNKAIRE